MFWHLNEFNKEDFFRFWRTVAACSAFWIKEMSSSPSSEGSGAAISKRILAGKKFMLADRIGR